MEGTYSIYSYSYIQSYIEYIQIMQHQTEGGDAPSWFRNSIQRQMEPLHWLNDLFVLFSSHLRCAIKQSGCHWSTAAHFLIWALLPPRLLQAVAEESTFSNGAGHAF